jgi:hypothetical protein
VTARAAALVLAAGACAGASPAGPAPTPCPTTSVRATRQAELDALAGCRVLPALTVRGAGALDLAPLASLTAVDGDLVLGPTTAWSSGELPVLARVGGTLRVSGNAALGTLFLPALTEAGAVELVGNVALVSISAPRLAHLGRLAGRGNGALALLLLGAPPASLTLEGSPTVQLEVVSAPTPTAGSTPSPAPPAPAQGPAGTTHSPSR